MNHTPPALITRLKTHLPPSWHETLDALSEQMLNANAPLRVILLGAFSVGKTSLINRLIGEPLLKTACEETTALPTFIEYGVKRTMRLIGSDGSMLPLDAAGLAQVTTEAPEGAACATLMLPLQWLQGITLIDLPGLGGLSARNRDYTAAQIQQADAVLYLLAPRGPDADDIATLQQISRYGKRIKLLVTRWDEVEDAVMRGEQRPDLQHWSSQIQSETGIRARLAPVDHTGLGREDILNFLTRARDELEAIRLRRLCAELRPQLENALGQNADAQRVCAVQSEEDIHTLRSELLQRRADLTEFKSLHHARAQESRQTLVSQTQEIIQDARRNLESALIPLEESVHDAADWDDFAEQGTEALRTALNAVAQALSELSAEHGGLELPEAQMSTLNLRLPPAEPVEVADFLDMGRFAQLQSELETRAAEFAVQTERLAQLPEADLNESQRLLRELLMQREQLAAQPLPRTVQRLESSNAGAVVGRMLGEIADIGLLFVNPAWAGAKVASLVGKTAKIASITVKTANITTTATKAVKAAQLARQGGRITGVPPQVAEKLKILEGLSLGYWGERVGSALGGRPQEIEVIDPEAQAQQQAMLAEIDTRAREVRAQLARCEDIANERQLTGWALEQNRKEQGHLQTRLNELHQRAEERYRAYEQSVREEHQQQLARHVKRALAQWRRSFEQQTGHMRDLLQIRVRDDWDAQIEILVSERLAELEALNTRIDSVPAERAAALGRLCAESEKLQTALALLN